MINDHCGNCGKDFERHEDQPPQICSDCYANSDIAAGYHEWLDNEGLDAFDDDHGPPDSPEGDCESDHVWADLARSEQEW